MLTIEAKRRHASVNTKRLVIGPGTWALWKAESRRKKKVTDMPILVIVGLFIFFTGVIVGVMLCALTEAFKSIEDLNDDDRHRSEH